MAPRSSRAAAKQAAAALKNTPMTYEENEDEIMQDVATSDIGEPQDVDEEEEAVDEEEENTPARDSEPSSRLATPSYQQPQKRKKLGRPPKNKPPGWDDPDPNDDSEKGTPGRRRGRGGFGRGGGKGARRGGPSHVTQQPIDKEGNMLDVINDEVDLPEDAEGEAKVDKLGYLQGDRDYRCRTFKVLGRGDRLYMLSTEPARCVGFRDSYLFFNKHKRLFKIIIDEDEKRDLIDRDLIPHSYKGRAIGIVTARSVFREFGAQIIIGGKRIIDDYEVTRNKLEGLIEGELAVPGDIVKPGEPYDKNQYVAWHGASSVYHTGQPTIPLQNGKVLDHKKRKATVTDVNWQLEHALEASRFNTQLTLDRRRNLQGVFDCHTNVMLFPAIMQPSHARWEAVPTIGNSVGLKAIPAETSEDQKETNGKHESLANGDGDASASIYPVIKPIYYKNFLTVDSIYENPSSSHFGAPGPESDFRDIGSNGISSIPEDVLAELPLECRVSLDKVLEKEKAWKAKWRTETVDAMRRAPIIDKGLIS